ncbi:MAG: methyltransferase domain-containing protein [Aureliella sp.]
MIERTLEPEVMDAPNEAIEYDLMDHSSANHSFIADLLGGGSVGPNVLDLGTGTAEIPVLLCDQTDDCRVVAVDASVSMLEIARHKVIESGHETRIQLDHSDVKTFQWNDELFHTVISNSLIHHLPAPAAFLPLLPPLLQPGGRLFIRDLARPDSEATVEKLVTTYAGDETEFSQQLFRQSLIAALTADEMRDIVSQIGLDPQSVQMTSDRHWTCDAVLPR